MRFEIKKTETDKRRDVDLERDRRISKGVMWNGKLFQTRTEKSDLANIMSMSIIASAKVNSGMIDQSYRWLHPDEDFFWVAADNSKVKMTAAEMVDFAATAAAWDSRHKTVAASIKNESGGVPANYENDERWPTW